MFPSSFSWEGLKAMCSSRNKYISAPILVLLPFCNKENLGSLEKLLTVEPGWEIYKMSQKNFVVPESKKVLLKNSKEEEGKKKKTHQNSQWLEACQRDTDTNWKRANGQSQKYLNNRINNLKLNYNLKYKINTLLITIMI